jgi:hypothetical protein
MAHGKSTGDARDKSRVRRLKGLGAEGDGMGTSGFDVKDPDDDPPAAYACSPSLPSRDRIAEVLR